MLIQLTDNELGELLRRYAFTGDGLGCYETFNVRDGAFELNKGRRFIFVHSLTPTEILNEDPSYIDELIDECKVYVFEYPCYELGSSSPYEIYMFYHWDGDGKLFFQVKHDNKIIRQIVNTDCKKTYGWRQTRNLWDYM